MSWLHVFRLSSASFGRKARKRLDPITAILETLRALGHLA